jgi:hypothetical protein
LIQVLAVVQHDQNWDKISLNSVKLRLRRNQDQVFRIDCHLRRELIKHPRGWRLESHLECDTRSVQRRHRDDMQDSDKPGGPQANPVEFWFAEIKCIIRISSIMFVIYSKSNLTKRLLKDDQRALTIRFRLSHILLQTHYLVRFPTP